MQAIELAMKQETTVWKSVIARYEGIDKTVKSAIVRDLNLTTVSPLEVVYANFMLQPCVIEDVNDAIECDRGHQKIDG